MNGASFVFGRAVYCSQFLLRSNILAPAMRTSSVASSCHCALSANPSSGCIAPILRTMFGISTGSSQRTPSRLTLPDHAPEPEDNRAREAKRAHRVEQPRAAPGAPPAREHERARPAEHVHEHHDRRHGHEQRARARARPEPEQRGRDAHERRHARRGEQRQRGLRRGRWRWRRDERTALARWVSRRRYARAARDGTSWYAAMIGESASPPRRIIAPVTRMFSQFEGMVRGRWARRILDIWPSDHL
jgi:hypothetical protein